MGQQNRGCEKCCHCCNAVTKASKPLCRKGSGDDRKIEMLSYAVICFLMCRRRKVGVTEKTESIFRKVSRGTIGAAEDFALVLD